MNDSILSLSDRGQITIPKKIRKKITVKHFVCSLNDGEIVLTPLQTREDFIAELDEAEKDWDKNGGTTLDDIKSKYKL